MDLLAGFVSLVPVSGAASGELFLAEAGGERSVLRMYVPGNGHAENAHEVDAAVLSLVRELLPVPRVLELRRAEPASAMPALLVTSYLPGERGDHVLASLREAGDEDALARLGERMGRVAAVVAGVAMLRRGRFRDAELHIVPSDERDEGAESDGAEPASDVQLLLDTVERASLVHGDLRPENLLVDPERLEVTGVVGWGHARAGHPFADLGSLVGDDPDPSYADGVLRAWTRHHGGDRERVLHLARAADLDPRVGDPRVGRGSRDARSL